MAMYDYVFISPELTHAKEWLQGQIIEIEDNPFNGRVITVKTNDGLIFWERESFFKKIA